MNWNLTEALEYYKRQGAPMDQSALIALLTEIQREHGGSIPRPLLAEMAAVYGVKENLFLAIIRRVPRLRLSDAHTLELCTGPNCGKAAALAASAEQLCKNRNITLRSVPCMRLCGKGPNLKFDGKLYHQATEALLAELLKDI